LNEGYLPSDGILKPILIEAFEEESSLVSEDLWFEYNDFWDREVVDFHTLFFETLFCQLNHHASRTGTRFKQNAGVGAFNTLVKIS
jgi:hypothetical protein